MMYVDKLDGKINAEYFDTKATEWRNEQNRISDTIQQHQTASQIYITEGIKLLELAQNVYPLFLRQPAEEKRRLLNFVVSNSVWDGHHLQVNLRQPFDIIAESNSAATKSAPLELAETDHFDKWLRG